jgi:alkyldihydroxyacetonephosphate synthase
MTVVDMPVHGWGDPARRTGLPAHAAAWLRDELGAARPSLPEPVRPAPSRLAEPAREALAAVVGSSSVLVDDASRLLRAAGKSYLDLLRLRAGGEVPAPDAVVLPGSPEEVAGVLRLATDHGFAVVPFGGGTSVVGGVAPDRGPHGAVVALDLRRLDRLVSVDPVSRTAVLQAGLRGPAADALLRAHGLTLGHLPQSYEHATIGGFAATRSAGQASTGYGRFDDLVVSAVVQTPAGELRLGRGARSAAGPDLLQLLLGSEGALGVVTEVGLRVRPVPQAQRFEGAFFRTWGDGLAALRELEQEALAPDVLRLSDPDETRVQLALSGTGRLSRGLLRLRGYGAGCLAVLGWDGTEQRVDDRRHAAARVLTRYGGLVVGTGPGERWAHGRFDGPYLRDDLLDAGYLVETLETSATWSRLDEVRDAVREALRAALPGTPPVVMCHVSHAYPHGASLYVTVLALRSTSDPVGQWQRAKDAASAAIVATGATITHHHAVGADHREHLPAEVGELGVEVLGAVKRVLDPRAVLNPGTLLPPPAPPA